MNKYHARQKVVDGITFDSQAEARRYWELKMMEKAGEITDLEVHRVFPLDINGIHVANYEADFVYVRLGIGIVEDVKGVKTAVYKLKKKLVLALYGIEIVEVEA